MLPPGNPNGRDFGLEAASAALAVSAALPVLATTTTTTPSTKATFRMFQAPSYDDAGGDDEDRARWLEQATVAKAQPLFARLPLRITAFAKEGPILQVVFAPLGLDEVVGLRIGRTLGHATHLPGTPVWNCQRRRFVWSMKNKCSKNKRLRLSDAVFDFFHIIKESAASQLCNFYVSFIHEKLLVESLCFVLLGKWISTLLNWLKPENFSLHLLDARSKSNRLQIPNEERKKSPAVTKKIRETAIIKC